MTSHYYVCDKPCPQCGGVVELFGSACYPEDGISAECLNEECDYELRLYCRADNLIDVVKRAHGFVYNAIKGH
jgi:hypothetical protein